MPCRLACRCLTTSSRGHRLATPATCSRGLALDGTGTWTGRSAVCTAICNLVEVVHERGRDIEALTLNAAVEADDDRAPKLFGPFGAHYFSFLTDIGEAVESDEAPEARRVGSCLDHAAAATFAVDALKRAKETADHRPDGVWPIDP